MLMTTGVRKLALTTHITSAVVQMMRGRYEAAVVHVRRAVRLARIRPMRRLSPVSSSPRRDSQRKAPLKENGR